MNFKSVFVYPKYPEKLRKLFTLAYNIWTLWDKEALNLFNQMDQHLFLQCKKNPILFLHTLSDKDLNRLEKDQGFLFELDRIWDKFEQYNKHVCPFKDQFDNNIIAYFSMEYGVHDSLPLYAGGLGILSGDHLKGSSDVRIPLVAIGLLYKYGYFSQRINIHGYQEEIYKENNPYFMPIKEVRNKNSESLFITVMILNTEVKVKIWSVSIGQIKLYLLDTNVSDNPPEFRDITNYLYVADKEKRLQQEIILGIGGYRALQALNIIPTVFHINEGHSAFLILERFRDFIVNKKKTYDEALFLIKNTTVFTTHTPVEAGNENFPLVLVKKYLDSYLASFISNLNLIYEKGLYHDNLTFWMPTLAIHYSKYINGVSQIHASVSRTMWRNIFSQQTEEEIPIIPITNAVHFSWISKEITSLLDRYLGQQYIYAGHNPESWDKIKEISDEELWDAHKKNKQLMINFIRNKITDSLLEKGSSLHKIDSAAKILNPHFLTIAFARRAAPYKRPTLILKDKERLKSILLNPDKPVQLIFAGKAHPADLIGKNLIKEIADFAFDYNCEDRVVFLEDYNMTMAEYLVQGVDVWLNTPVKPMEASGTSGIKAGMNGSLNLSILDGWWNEGFNGKNGWSINAGEIYSNNQMRDAAEASQIYDLLEEEIIPLYYNTNSNDIPEKWIVLMKEAIYSITKDFNIDRMIHDYAFSFYIPAILSYKRLCQNNFDNLGVFAHEYQLLKDKWDIIKIKDVFTNIDKKGTLLSGDKIEIDCYVYLDSLDPNIIQAEVYYKSSINSILALQPLKFIEKYNDNVAKFQGSLLLKASGLQFYNIRIAPSNIEIREIAPEFIKWKD